MAPTERTGSPIVEPSAPMGYNLLVSKHSPTRLRYDAGTIVIEGEIPLCIPPQFEWDARVERYRAPRSRVGRRWSISVNVGVRVEDLSSRAAELDFKPARRSSPRALTRRKRWLPGQGRDARERGAADRRGKDVRGPGSHPKGRAQRARGRPDDRPDEPVVFAAGRLPGDRGRNTRRRVSRGQGRHRNHLRQRIYICRRLRQSIRSDGFR